MRRETPPNNDDRVAMQSSLDALGFDLSSINADINWSIFEVRNQVAMLVTAAALEHVFQQNKLSVQPANS